MLACIAYQNHLIVIKTQYSNNITAMANTALNLDTHKLYLDSVRIFAEPFGDLCKCKSLEVEVGNLSFAF